MDHLNDSLKNFNALANQILNTDIKVTDGPSKEIFATKKDLCGNIVALEKELEKEIEEGFKQINAYYENTKNIDFWNLLMSSYSYQDPDDPKKLINFKNSSQKIRNDLAKKLFIAWYFPFYKYGIIHGDPHLGNYSVDKNNNINLLIKIIFNFRH